MKLQLNSRFSPSPLAEAADYSGMEARKHKSNTEPWRLEDALKERSLVQGEVQILVDAKGAKGAIPELLSRVADSASQIDMPEEQLRCVFLVAEVIDLDSKGTELSPSALKRLTDLTRLILNRNRIAPSDPEFGFLHAESAIGLARRALKECPWETLSRIYGHDSVNSRAGDTTSKILESKALLRLGAINRAQNIFSDLAKESSNQASRTFARIQQIRCLRLSNKLDLAEELLRSESIRDQLDSTDRLNLEWEQLFLSAQRKGSILAPLKETGRNRPHRKFRPMLLTWLWAHSLSHQDFLKQMPASRSIREALPEDSEFESRDEWIVTLKSLESIEAAYNVDTNLLDRSMLISDVVSSINNIGDLDVRLLTLAATARWYARNGFIVLASLASNSYHEACLSLTLGRDSDLFKVLGDILATEAAMLPEANSGLVEKDFLWLARTLRLSSFAMGTTQSVVKSKVKQAFTSGSKKQKIIDREIEEHAARIRGYLRIAKGSLLKTAQAMVFIDATLPEPIAREIRELSLNIEPLDHTLSRKILEQELQRPIESVFDHWNPYPIGAASIGQVHRARLKDGADVAIKIQYPRMKEILEDQKKAAKLLSPVCKFFYPSLDVERAFEEISDLLLEETDYKKELHHLNKAWEASLKIPGIRVPKPIPDLSTEKVITMEFLEGSRFWDFVRGVNQEEKNRVAEVILRSHFEMRYTYKIVNYDPHPGNFLFSPDYVGLIDFGSASADSEIMLDGFREVYRMVRDNEKHRTFEMLQKLGFVGNPKSFDADAAWALLVNDFQPFVEDKPFKISMEHVKSSLAYMTKNQQHWNLPPQWLGHFRSNIGLYGVLAALDAEVNFHRAVAHLLE